MSDTSDHSPQLPEDELLAAEYALGVLAGTERAAAARRIARERGFAALVAAWEERLAPWAAEIADVAPPPQSGTASPPPCPRTRRKRAGLWQSLAFWRGLRWRLARWPPPASVR